ncbi:MAG: Alpha/beta hydrolase fold [Herminiimonas sp.]|nr:Alpha/beta hydrolase fold [Herminiimonas sp.]
MKQRIHANGIDISYEVAGEGPWLIFSHSLGCGKAMWQPQFEALAKSHRVLRYDTRGHGESSAPAGPYTLDLLAQDVKALCDALDIRTCHFVGLSMGGMIGQTVALNYPELLLSLTLANTSSFYGPQAQPFWQTRSQTALTQGMAPLVEPSMARWFTAPFRASQPALMQQASQWIMETPPVGYSACCQAIAVIDTTAMLERIKIPVLVIAGADDAATPPAMAERIHAQIAGSRLVSLKPAAHISSIEQADRFTDALRDFLSEA